MRLATYNVENFFTRARALNMNTWAEGKQTLDAYWEMNTVLEQAVYSDKDKARLIEIMKTLGIDKKDDSHFVILRQNRGNLVKRSMFGGVNIVANGRADWVGWLELKNEVVNETATRNCAQVVRDLNADIIGICEAESRQALMQFSGTLLPIVGAKPYEHIMLIDGNDDRGIDVGVMTRPGFELQWMKSHVDDKDNRGGLIFSRDCPEYGVVTPANERVWVLVNHFKSKGYGEQKHNDARRHAQAEQVRLIYERLKAEGAELIAVMGDLNDTPESATLAPLLKHTDLKDVSQHPSFEKDAARPGTHGSGLKDKIDYILLSPKLFERVKDAGIWRKGVWGGKNGTLWDHYKEIQKAEDASSDHAAMWVDLAA